VALLKSPSRAQILGGLGLLVSQTRRAAAWELVALLIADFPANIYKATNPIDAGAASIAPVLRWGRLFFQPLLVWWLICAPGLVWRSVERTFAFTSLWRSTAVRFMTANPT
jgi:hypothetical protein